MEEITTILDGLKKRLMPIGVLIFSGVFFSFFFMDSVLKRISTDLLPEEMKLIALDPLEVILLKLKISVVCGVIVALPLILYYLVKVVDERIRPVDFNLKKSNMLVIAFFAVLLFICGASYAYFLMLPLFFSYMYQMAIDSGITSTWSIAPFINFVVMMTAVFGVVFELPLILTLLVRQGIVKLETLKAYRRHAYVALLILSALITSPDVFTQLIIGVPLILFYEISVFVAGFTVVEDECDNIHLGDLASKNGLILGLGMILASFSILFLQILPADPQLNVSLINNSMVFLDQINRFRLQDTAFILPLIIPIILGIMASYQNRKTRDEKTAFDIAIILFIFAGALFGLFVMGLLSKYPYLIPGLIGLGATSFCAGMLSSSEKAKGSVSVVFIIPVAILIITLVIFLYKEVNILIVGLAIIGAISIICGERVKSNFQKG